MQIRHNPVPASVSPQLDTLRGLSAIAVLVGHTNQVVVAPTWSGGVGAFGLLAQAAVMMFFVLSGFLICKAITGNIARNGGFNTHEYAVGRFNRIIPPLAFSIALVSVLWVAAPLLFPTGTRQFAIQHPFNARNGFDVDMADLIGSALFVNGFITGTINANGPLWSLSYEVWYYLIAGLIAAMPLRFGLLAAALVMGALCVASRTFVMYSAVWFAGAVVALAPYDRRLGWLAVISGGVCLVCAAWLGFVFLRSGVNAADPAQMAGWTIRYYNVMLGVFFASMLYLLVHGKFSIHSPQSSRRAAGFSYTLYIVHFPLLLLAYGTVQPWIHGSMIASLAVGMVLTIAVIFFARWVARWVENVKPLRTVRGARLAFDVKSE